MRRGPRTKWRALRSGAASARRSNAEPGSPVRFDPKYTPASGQVIKVTVSYELDGKLHTVSAQEWVRDVKTQKPMTHDWVFAGSRLVANPLDRDKPLYLANDGDVI